MESEQGQHRENSGSPPKAVHASGSDTSISEPVVLVATVAMPCRTTVMVRESTMATSNSCACYDLRALGLPSGQLLHLVVVEGEAGRRTGGRHHEAADRGQHLTNLPRLNAAGLLAILRQLVPGTSLAVKPGAGLPAMACMRGLAGGVRVAFVDGLTADSRRSAHPIERTWPGERRNAVVLAVDNHVDSRRSYGAS